MKPMLERPRPEDFGANSWLVEEMYERFRDNPASVGEGLKSLRFFTIMANGKPANASTKPETISIVISKT